MDCGHSYCLVRSRSGGPLRGFGTGLPNGRTEFPIGRSAVRTTVGKVRTTIKKVRYPTGKVPGQIVPKSPSVGASVLLYRQSPLEFPDSPDSTGHLKPGLPIWTLECDVYDTVSSNCDNYDEVQPREAFPFLINDILDINPERTSSRRRPVQLACFRLACFAAPRLTTPLPCRRCPSPFRPRRLAGGLFGR